MKKYLFIKYTLVLIFGILFGNISLQNLNKEYFYLLFIILIFLYFLSFNKYIFKIKTRNIKIIFGFLGYSLIFCIGFIISARQEFFSEKSKILNDRKIKAYIGLITDKKFSKNFCQIELDVKKILRDSAWIMAEGKVLVFVPKQQKINLLDIGEILLIGGNPETPKSSFNIWDFDYKNFLYNKGIFYVHYTVESSIMTLGKRALNPILKLALDTRQWADETLKANIPSKLEYEVASSIILGIRNSLDEDIKSTYQKAGVIHVLAVSGMHVLFLFTFLQFILSPFSKSKTGKNITFIIIIFLLWLFALISGFSPSVIRATVMFSFYIIGTVFYNKKIEVFNTIAVSAFFMLLINPYHLYDL